MDCEDFKLFLNSRELSLNFKAVENNLKIQSLNVKHFVSKNFILKHINTAELNSSNLAKKAKLITTFSAEDNDKSNEFLNKLILNQHIGISIPVNNTKLYLLVHYVAFPDLVIDCDFAIFELSATTNESFLEIFLKLVNSYHQQECRSEFVKLDNINVKEENENCIQNIQNDLSFYKSELNRDTFELNKRISDWTMLKNNFSTLINLEENRVNDIKKTISITKSKILKNESDIKLISTELVEINKLKEQLQAENSEQHAKQKLKLEAEKEKQQKEELLLQIEREKLEKKERSERKAQLKEMILCKSCFEKPKEVVYKTCYHFDYCFDCVKNDKKQKERKQFNKKSNFECLVCYKLQKIELVSFI